MPETKKSESTKYVKAYLFMTYENLLKVLHQKDLKLVLPEETNDPFEFRGKDDSEAVLYGRKNIGFLSFSSDYKSAAMWGHYANSHKGCCIEFTFPIFSHSTTDVAEYWELNVDIKRRNYFPSFYTDEGFLEGNPILWRVKYSNIRENWDSMLGSIGGFDKKYEYSISSVFITKDKSWNFEKELRILFFTETPEIIRNDMFFVSGLNSYMSRILLGVKSNISISKLQSTVNTLKPENALYAVDITKVNYASDTFEVIA